LSVLVPGVGVESDRFGDGAAVVSSAVWSVAPLGCSASCELDEFGMPLELGASVGRGASVDVEVVAMGDGGGPVAGVGLAAATGASAASGADTEVGVKVVVGEAAGPVGDAGAGEA
jgi:hypothetical protein